MQINLETLNCNICYSTIEEAVSCQFCGNSFCQACADDYEKSTINNKRTLKCPMCNKEGFNRYRNILVDDLIKSALNGKRTYKCQKCNRIFLDNKKYNEHTITCSKIKCCCCSKIFNDADTFINHFNEKNNFQEKLFVCTFLLNSNLKNIPSNFMNDLRKTKKGKDIINPSLSKNNNNNDKENIMLSNETKIDKFVNYFEKIQKSDYSVIEKEKCTNLFFKEYDLIFCGKINNKINGKRCKAGNEMCANCMRINQLYHGLKKHYLINCAGRACTYNKGTVHCNCKFEKETKHETGRIFSYDFICSDKNNVCLACENMNKLLDKYLDQKTIDALIQRDKLSGFE